MKKLFLLLFLVQLLTIGLAQSYKNESIFKYGFNPSSSIEYMYQDSLPTKLFMNGTGGSLYIKKYIFRNSHAPYGSFIKAQFDWSKILIDSKLFPM